MVQTVTYDAYGNAHYVDVAPNTAAYPVTVGGGLTCDTQTGYCDTGSRFYEPSAGAVTEYGAPVPGMTDPTPVVSTSPPAVASLPSSTTTFADEGSISGEPLGCVFVLVCAMTGPEGIGDFFSGVGHFFRAAGNFVSGLFEGPNADKAAIRFLSRQYGIDKRLLKEVFHRRIKPKGMSKVNPEFDREGNVFFRTGEGALEEIGNILDELGELPIEE